MPPPTPRDQPEPPANATRFQAWLALTNIYLPVTFSHTDQLAPGASQASDDALSRFALMDADRPEIQAHPAQPCVHSSRRRQLACRHTRDNRESKPANEEHPANAGQSQPTGASAPWVDCLRILGGEA